MTEKLVNELRSLVGVQNVKLGEEVPRKNWSDWSGYRPTKPKILLLPKSVAEVSSILKFCNDRMLPVVPQGGMTGLVAGAHPQEDEIAISLERMSGIQEVDCVSGTITALAGTTLEEIQRVALENEFLCGIDLGARGTCTIGGNVATNAGGNHVIRYGMTRDNIRSMQVVLANGQVIESKNKMVKNNTGYDWSHLFIGSEGTLGLITSVTLVLHPIYSGVESALIQLRDTAAAISLLRHLERKLPNGLLTFEALWKQFYAMAVDVVGTRVPFEQKDKVYVLIETPMVSGNDGDLVDILEEMMTAGYIEDAVVAQSEAERKSFWSLRESVYEHPHFYPIVIGFDISIPLDQMEKAIVSLESEVSLRLSDVPWVVFGHLADSNIHVNFMPKLVDAKIREKIESLIYKIVEKFRGSISAEHGIGRMKAPYLNLSRSKSEIELMKQIKRTFDPNGILSPNRIFLAQKS